MHKGTRLKRLSSLLLALSLLLCLAPAAFAVVDQSEAFYVADYANVLSAATEQQIIDANALLEEQCQGAQIVVVTTDYLGGMYSDEYARKLFYDWGVGSEEYNNGMLLLLGVQENKAWLEYGLGLSMDEEEASMLLDMYFWDDFDREDYNSAVSSLFSALLTWYDGTYGSRVAPSGQAAAGQSNTGSFAMIAVLLFLIVLVVLIIILVVVLSRISRRRRVYRSGWSTRRYTPPPPPQPFIPRAPAPRRPVAPPPPHNGGFRGSGASPARPSSSPRPSTPSRPSSPPSRPSGGVSRGGGGRPGGGAGRR